MIIVATFFIQLDVCNLSIEMHFRSISVAEKNALRILQLLQKFMCIGVLRRRRINGQTHYQVIEYSVEHFAKALCIIARCPPIASLALCFRAQR